MQEPCSQCQGKGWYIGTLYDRRGLFPETVKMECPCVMEARLKRQQEKLENQGR